VGWSAIERHGFTGQPANNETPPLVTFDIHARHFTISYQ